MDRSNSVQRFFGFFLRTRKEKTKFFIKTPCNLLRASFALYYTYSFLPDRSEIKTCQEQVSHRLPKMNLCPPAPCWGLRTPIPRGSISSHSFAAELQKKTIPLCFRFGIVFLFFHKPTQNKVRFFGQGLCDNENAKNKKRKLTSASKSWIVCSSAFMRTTSPESSVTRDLHP